MIRLAYLICLQHFTVFEWYVVTHTFLKVTLESRHSITSAFRIQKKKRQKGLAQSDTAGYWVPGPGRRTRNSDFKLMLFPPWQGFQSPVAHEKALWRWLTNQSRSPSPPLDLLSQSQGETRCLHCQPQVIQCPPTCLPMPTSSDATSQSMVSRLTVTLEASSGCAENRILLC